MTPLALLKQLIAIPSVNPMGREMEGPTILEGGMSDFLVGFFAERSMECERIEVVPGRDNVIARLAGADDLPTVLFDAHTDTVPVDQMTIDPFDPSVREGRVYGRGACDVKGGLAAMISAMEQLAREGGKHPTVIMACTCDEERGQQGAQDVVRLFSPDDNPRSQLITSPPDMIIVAEPTELNVAAAHRGATRWKLRTSGKAAHSSDPSRGESAIYRMAPLVSLLEQYAEELRKSPAHPLCGPKTLSVGRIEGGESVNIVPASCSIEIDRRVAPGEDNMDVIAQVESYLRERVDIDFEMLPPWSVSLPLDHAENRELADRLHAVSSAAFPASRIIGVPFGTHAARYSQAGVPSVVFGPGSIEQAHTKDEWLEVNQLERASEILIQFLKSWTEN